MVRLQHQTLLVTGGTGLVGSHLVEALLPHKAHIIVPVRSIDPKSYFSSLNLDRQVTQVYADLTDYLRLQEIMIDYRVNYVIHLAAQALVSSAFYNPRQTLDTNIMGTVNILEATRHSPYVKGMIIASSDKAYGKLNRSYKETDSLQGDHPYEVSKSSADLIAQSYFKTYQLPVVITRFGNIYGSGDLNFDRLIPDICRCLILHRTLKIRSDGTFRRDYIYVKDVTDGYLKILARFEKVVGESFNFGSPENLSVMQVIEQVEHVTGKKVHYKILNTQKNEIPHQSLQYTKATKLLGWKPRYHLTEGLRITYDWYRQYFAA